MKPADFLEDLRALCERHRVILVPWGDDLLVTPLGSSLHLCAEQAERYVFVHFNACGEWVSGLPAVVPNHVAIEAWHAMAMPKIRHIFRDPDRPIELSKR